MISIFRHHLTIVRLCAAILSLRFQSVKDSSIPSPRYVVLVQSLGGLPVAPLPMPGNYSTMIIWSQFCAPTEISLIIGR